MYLCNDIKLHVVVKFQFWLAAEYGGTPLFTLLPDPLWIEIVVPVRA